jgi:hypothetical protein
MKKKKLVLKRLTIRSLDFTRFVVRGGTGNTVWTCPTCELAASCRGATYCNGSCPEKCTPDPSFGSGCCPMEA